MTVKPFDHPVRFMANARLVWRVTNTDEALHFLEWKWPHDEGRAHQMAVHVCKEVLGGACGAEKAREAFLRALNEGEFDLAD